MIQYIHSVKRKCIFLSVLMFAGLLYFYVTSNPSRAYLINFNNEQIKVLKAEPPKVSTTKFPSSTTTTSRSSITTSKTVYNQEINKRLEEWWNERVKLRSNMSELGRILFLNEPPPKPSDKNFTILIWKYGPAIAYRHIQQFTNVDHDPFEHCSTKNCRITYKDEELTTADMVVFQMHEMEGTRDLPKNIQQRNPDQIWTFLTDESPYHTFSKRFSYHLNSFDGVFNWSMTYRMDAEIPVPYGRTFIKEAIEGVPVNVTKRRDVLVAVMGSNCGGQNHRWDYVKKLSKFIRVDVYGDCGKELKNGCPGHISADCTKLNEYMFYLAFENSNCDEYITEKVWWNSLSKFTIPIVMGGSKKSYDRTLPLDSYITTEDFSTPEDLAKFVKQLNVTGEYVKYHQWRKYFRIENEHAYFKTRGVHYCRICEALNYNKRERKTYNKLDDYWSIRRDCHGSMVII